MPRLQRKNFATPDDVRTFPKGRIEVIQLLSSTTRDLLDGSGLILEPRGEHELKGLSGARPIFALQR